MNVKVNSIADRGNASKERLVLKVLAATDIGEYAILRSQIHGGTVTTGVENAFWFPDKRVNAGDLVVIYTRAGTQSEKTLPSGSTAHFFYWGHKNGTFWESAEYGAVIAHIDEWIDHMPGKPK